MSVPRLTPGEAKFCVIRAKDYALRSFLSDNALPDTVDAPKWLAYLTSIKNVLGNLNNDISFIATLLVRAYLERRFGDIGFDAARKPQGAPGIDIAVKTAGGNRPIRMPMLKTADEHYTPAYTRIRACHGTDRAAAGHGPEAVMLRFIRSTDLA